MDSYDQTTYVYLLHLETNVDEIPDRIFKTKEDAIAAATLYMESGLNNVKDMTNILKTSSSTVLMLYGERPWSHLGSDSYLDTFAIVRKIQLE